ncbi:unnamed protein product [Larinioides sclopetarius]|uniref:C3H1-type domain-containing protein n=1 Tax=Larinioides sclopetarius TaxID=280406 RepID=A0AAV2AX92_9ARAC
MNPNQEQSCFSNSNNDEDKAESKDYDNALIPRAEVLKDSWPLIRLVGESQSSPHLYSPQLLTSQSSRFVTHAVDDHCPPIYQFKESKHQLSAHSSDGNNWDLNHMPQRRPQYIENSEKKISFPAWSHSKDLSDEQTANFSCPAQSQEYTFFPSQHQEVIQLDTSRMPQGNIQYIENPGANFSISQWPCYNDVHPQQINNFSDPAQSLESKFFPPLQQNSVCRKRLPCFINITNKTKTVSPTLSSQPGSDMHWTDSDIKQTRKQQSLIDPSTINTMAGFPMCSSDSDVNQASKMPVNIFPGSENSFQIFGKSVTSTPDQSSSCTEKLPCSFNVANRVQIDSPMVSEASSLEHCISSNVAKNNKHANYFLMKTIEAGTPIPVTDPNSNQAKNLQQSMNFSMLTSQASSIYTYPTMITSRASSTYPTMVTSQASFTYPTIITSQASSTYPAMITSQASFTYPTMITSQASSTYPAMITSQASFTYPTMITSQASCTYPAMITCQASSTYPTMITSQACSPIHLINPNINRTINNFQPISLKGILYKTELCKRFLRGHCEFGDQCEFAHGHDDLRDVTKHPLYKKKVCIKFFKYGYCRVSDKCVFIHVPNPNFTQSYDLGSDGETSPLSSYSSPPPNRNPLNSGTYLKTGS